MTRFQAWLLHASNLLVGGTGAVYAWMRYVYVPPETDDPFAPLGHPAEPSLQHAHILFAPLLVFAVGMIWPRHVWARIRSGYRPRRSTGLVLAAMLLPMTVSGYLVQVSVSDAWRTVWVWVHGTTSTLWILAYALHPFSGRGTTPDAVHEPRGTAEDVTDGSRAPGR